MKIRFAHDALFVAAGLLLAVGLAAGQEKPEGKQGGAEATAQNKPVSVYRMDFVVRELENGKRINSRNYTLSAKNNEWAGLRVGSQVPSYTFESQGNKGTKYLDAGINIDSRPEERDGEVVLSTRFESTSVVPPEKAFEEHGGGSSLGPTFRRVRFNGDALVSLGKPSVIATLDDVATNRRYEIEVTVTKVK